MTGGQPGKTDRDRLTRRPRAGLRAAIPAALGSAVLSGWLVVHLSSAPHAAAAENQSPRPPTRSAPSPVQLAVAGLVAGRPTGSVSVAALDTVTGAAFNYGPSSGMPAGSVIKLFLLEAYLLQQQDEGRQPGDAADPQLTAMVENSDNESANAVYAAIGGRAGGTAALGRLGLTATVLDPNDEFGLSATSAADQVVLLRNLVTPTSPLSPGSRSYALNLMRNVEADQRWGVSAAADPGTAVANKDGWLGVDADDDLWLVNSVGVVTVHGHPTLLAVLTQHDDDFASGVALVQNLARAAAGR